MRTISKIIAENYYRLEKDKILVKKIRTKDRPLSIGVAIDTAFTIPPKTGVCYRLYYLSKALHSKGVELKLFICNRNYRNQAAVLELCQERELEIHIIPETVFYSRSKMLRILSRARLDAVQFEDSETALFFGEYLKEKLHIPVIIELHDVGTVLKKTLGGFSPKEIAITDFIHFASGEIADLLIAMTEEDRRYFIEEIGLSSSRLVLSPNGVDPNIFPYLGPNLKKKNIIFVGNMFYQPNKDAVKRIIDSVLPSIKNNVGVRFVGMVPSDLIYRYGHIPKVTFTGFIKDLNSELRKATIAIAPLTAGSGMKVKVLNYAAAGLPIITTSIGSNGYDKLPGLVIEDEIKNFPTIVNRLLSSPRTLRRIGKQNRNAVVQHYTWEKVGKHLAQTYRQFLAQSSFPHKSSSGWKVKKLPRPFWLKEKRMEVIPNKYHYIIKAGKVSTRRLH